MATHTDFRLDVFGVCCPSPLIEQGKAIKDLRP
jgi:TusA-related sulfurtransferase